MSLMCPIEYTNLASLPCLAACETAGTRLQPYCTDRYISKLSSFNARLTSYAVIAVWLAVDDVQSQMTLNYCLSRTACQFTF